MPQTIQTMAEMIRRMLPYCPYPVRDQAHSLFQEIEAEEKTVDPLVKELDARRDNRIRRDLEIAENLIRKAEINDEEKRQQVLAAITTAKEQLVQPR